MPRGQTAHCRFSDAEVVEYRRLFGENCSPVTVRELAEERGITEHAVQAMLGGRSYKRLPGALTDRYHASWQRGWTPEQVLEFRRWYAADVTVTATSIVAKYGGQLVNVHRALVGRSYKDVPEPVAKMRLNRENPAHLARVLERNFARRRLTDEVALFIRLTYRPRVVSMKMLAKAHGCHESLIGAIINHRLYTNVPEVQQAKELMKPVRAFTDEQVAQARYWARRGSKKLSEIARHFGQEQSVTSNMIKGKTYAHLPDAVPESIWMLKRKKRKPIKMRTLRLIDHDERFGQANETREAA